jgi:hypothetical protein
LFLLKEEVYHTVVCRWKVGRKLVGIINRKYCEALYNYELGNKSCTLVAVTLISGDAIGYK